MTTTEIDPGGLGGRLEQIVRDAGVAGRLTARPIRVFGGNARTAWAFDVVDADDAVTPMIALVRSELGQVDASLEQEHEVLAQLVGSGVPAPRPVAIDAHGRYGAGAVVVLERLPGTADLAGLLRSDQERGRTLMRRLALHAASLHAVPLVDKGDPAHVVRSQLEQWREQLVSVSSSRVPALEAVFQWLAEHLPVPGTLSLVHGDLRPGNFLYEGDQVTGILDWELAHPGDPVEDLAWVYVGRWSPARLLPASEFVAAYEAAAGRVLDPAVFAYHRIYAEARFAVISHRAASLFASGASTNLKHADRVRELAVSLDACWTLIDADGRA